MSQNIIERYMELRQKMADIQDELEFLQATVIDQLRTHGSAFQYQGAELKLRVYRAWQYSDEVKVLQDKLTEARRHQRQNGVAVVTEERDVLVFKGSRNVNFDLLESVEGYETEA